MVTVMKTPGVYVVERNAFPNSVVEVATAVPAFVGHTQTAVNKDKSLLNVPRLITSLAEYHSYFGGGPAISFGLSTEAPDGGVLPSASAAGQDYYLTRSGQVWHLYYSMMLFFQNGGGRCYVVSVGGYDDSPDADRLMAGIDSLIKEQEPTMIVIPDAVLLGDTGVCAQVQKAALDQCRKTQSRFAILDVYDGYKERADDPDCVADFRNALGVNNLDYGAAYYPWLDTTVIQDSALGYKNFYDDGRATLQQLITAELGLGGDEMSPKAEQQSELVGKLDGASWTDQEQTDLTTNEALLNKSLIAMSPAFNALLGQIKESVNLLPPSGVIAGVYTAVDNSRGVWKAPANVSLNGVLKAAVNISHDEQEDLNVTPQGKSVNAIRSFIGEGTLVWGARTLDGNSLDWRYIQVRRTMIMLEQSIKLASKAYVFEANTANTWVTMKSMIRNFLTGIWKRGGLAGAVPDDAFSVHVGLGETMTSEDVLEGILRITVLVAVTRPAEFIEITFEQQMQKS